jgi:hypothetical protein
MKMAYYCQCSKNGSVHNEDPHQSERGEPRLYRQRRRDSLFARNLPDPIEGRLSANVRPEEYTLYLRM